MAIAVDVERVGKRYGRKVALENVSFSIAAGAVLGLVGPNGAGKSTLLRILLGLSRPTQGRIFYNRVSLWPNPQEAMKGVGGFVDTPHFYPYLTARENLLMLAELTGGPRWRVDEVLTYVHLERVKNERVAGYSHGMRQRLGIAAALLKRPGLVVLDEPQDGLDPARLQEMRLLIQRLKAELNATIIMSSHVIQDIERLCDSIAVFDAGRIRYFGSPAGLGSSIPGEEVLWEVLPVDQALSHLASLGINARRVGEGRVAAPWTGRLDLGQVNYSLMQQGLTVRTVTRRAASLEVRLLRYLEDANVDVR